MKKYKLYKLYILFIAVASFMAISSCSDDDNEAIYSGDKLLPTKVVREYVEDVTLSKVIETVQYTYDLSNRLTDISLVIKKTAQSGIMQYSSETSLEYDANGNITREFISQASTNGSSIENVIKNISYEGDEILIGSDNSLIRSVAKLNKEGQLEEYIVRRGDGEEQFTYAYDDRGNVSQSTLISGNYTLLNRYTFNQSNGIFRNVATPQWYLVHNVSQITLANNITIEQTNVNNEGFVDNYTYEYKYNKAGYPVMMISNPRKGILGVSPVYMTIEYTKVNE